MGLDCCRCYEDEKKVLDEDIAYLNNYLHKQYDFSNLIFHDEFLLGGYGHSSDEELEIIKKNAFQNKACLLIRPIQVKLLYGMCKVLLKKNDQIKQSCFGIFWRNDEFVFTKSGVWL